MNADKTSQTDDSEDPIKAMIEEFAVPGLQPVRL